MLTESDKSENNPGYYHLLIQGIVSVGGFILAMKGLKHAISEGQGDRYGIPVLYAIKYIL